HLVVKGLAVVVPHFEQPVDAKRRLGGKVRGGRASPHLAGKIANANLQKRYGVTRRLNKLEVVTSVPPATRGIDHSACCSEVPRKSAIVIYVRGEVDLGALIIDVSGSSSQRRGDKVRPIALVLVKIERIRERPR